jgi:alpha-tubulin suppressor-like RCC1 family protein
MTTYLSKWSVYLLCFVSVSISVNANLKFLGDVNGDEEINVKDFVMIVNHIQGIEYLTDTSKILQADANGDGLVNSYDLEESMKYRFGKANIPQLPLATVLNTSPYNGEADVSLSREFVVQFSMPIHEDTNLSKILSCNSNFPTTAKLSGNRMKATLYLNGSRWSQNSEITVTLETKDLKDVLGRQFSVDSKLQWSFTTVSTSGSDPSTSVSGYVFDSDDSNGEKPLEGVIISVPGKEEELNATTNSDGYFQLSGVPAGRFFVNVDGREVSVAGEDTSKLWSTRSYYAFVGKAWEATLGKDVNATRYGSYNENGIYQPDNRDGKIFLPLIKSGALKTVDPNADTNISFVGGYLDDVNESVRVMMQATSLSIPRGSLISDSGIPGGSVGIAPVAVDRLPEPLPDGLDLPLVITIQTDGATNFDRPIPATFPNADNLEPGAKSALWSFDHDKGKWEISGPMTVSEDGLTISTDPGVGIRQPGWHGSAPGAQIFGRGGFCGSTAEELNEASIQATLESVRAVEGELQDFASFASGIEESIFLGNWKFLNLAQMYINSSGSNESWQEVLSQNSGVASLSNQVANVNDAVDLILNDKTWVDLYQRADAIKKAATHCANKKRIDGSQQLIQEEFDNFSNFLESSKLAMSAQVEKYQRFAAAAEVMNSHLQSNLPPNLKTFSTDLSSYRSALRTLPAGRGGKRLDHQILELVKNWHQYLYNALSPYLTDLTTNSFVFLKRIGSPAEEGASPPITTQRIRVGRGGSYDAILRPDSVYEAWMLEPRRLQLGGIIFVSPPNGGNRRISNISLGPDNLGDRDNDLLSDRSERVIGTDPDKNDTDGDSLTDGFEVINGSDPNGGNPVITGVIATAPTNHGGFSDRVIAEDNLVFLGSREYGVDCFEVSGDADLPVWISSKDTDGSVRNFSFSNGWLAVADGDAGVVIFDFSDPRNPTTIAQHLTDSPANAISLAGGIVWVGLDDGTLFSMDAVHGYKINQTNFSAKIEEIIFMDGTLHVSTGYSLKVIHAQNGFFETNGDGTIEETTYSTYGSTPWRGGRRLFVGVGFAYLTNYNGFTHFDLSSPDQSYGTQIPTQTFGWRRIVANGSGLALSAEGLFAWRSSDVSLYTVDSNGSFLREGGFLENFETTFRTLGNAQDISVYNGLAYAADGNQGLQVINYRAYEKGTTPPDILDILSNDNNGSVEESSTFSLGVVVSDDIQVKYVEFWVDGNLTKTDGSYPFSMNYLVPRLADEQNFTTQIKVFDTGGNETNSSIQTWTISPDTTPPVLIDILPREGSILLAGDTILALFNEAIDPASVNNTTVEFKDISDPSNPLDVNDLNITYDDRLNAIQVKLPSYIAPGDYQITFTTDINDTLGIRLSQSKSQTFIGPSEIHGALWFDANHDRAQGSTESLLSGWTVFLDLDFNGELSSNEPSVLSGVDGNYSFVNLLPNTYSISEILPYKWVQTYPQSNPEDEMAPTRGFSLGGALYQPSWPDYLGNHLINPQGQHFSIIEPADQPHLGEEGIRSLTIKHHGPNGIDSGEISIFEGGSALNTEVALSNGAKEPILHLSTRNSNKSFFTNNFSEEMPLGPTTDIIFKMGDLERNQTHLLPLAYLLGQNLEPIAEYGIHDNASNLHEHLITRVSPAGKLLVVGLLDGDLSIGDRNVSETPDGSRSLFIARTTQDFGTEFAQTFSLQSSSYSNSQYAKLDIHFLDDDRFMVTHSRGLTEQFSDVFYYLFSSSGDLINSFSMPVENDEQGIAGLSANGFIQGWQTFKDSSSNHYATLLGSNETDVLIDVSDTIHWNLHLGAGFTYNQSDASYLFYPAGSTTAPSQTFSLVATGVLPFNYDNKYAISPSGDSLWIWENGLIRNALKTQVLARSASSSDRQIYNPAMYPYYYSVPYLANYNENGKIRVSSVLDFIAHPNLGFEIIHCKPVENNNGAWVVGILSGEQQNKTIKVGSSDIDLSSLPQTVAIRVGGATANNHLVELNEKTILENINFGNALEKTEVRSLEQFGGTDDDNAHALVTDSSGNSFLAGTISEDSDFNGSSVSNQKMEDGILAKYGQGGALAWKLLIGGDGNDSVQALAADELGGAYATGFFEGNLSIQDHNLTSQGGRDIFVIQVDENGTVLWARSFGGKGNDFAKSLYFNANGNPTNLLIGGEIENIALFDNGYLAADANASNGFVAELSSTDGKFLNGTSLNSDSFATVNAVSFDSSGRIVAGGKFSQNLRQWSFANDLVSDQIFHSTFNGDLGELNSSASDNNFSSDRAGFANRALSVSTGNTLSFPEDTNQSSSSLWTLSTWIQPKANQTTLMLGDDLNLSITWDNNNATISLGDTHHSITSPTLSLNADIWLPLAIRQSGGGQHINTISSKFNHTLVVQEDGSLWAMGNNSYKQLGTSDTFTRYCPTKIDLSVKVVQVATGLEHSLFLDEFGTLWGMGHSRYGQLAKSANNSTTYEPFVLENNVSQVVAGEHHSLYLDQSGNLFSFGINNNGQLGDGRNYDQTWTSNGYHFLKSTPALVSDSVIQVTAGTDHSLFIKEDGTLWAMGSNNYGQLGDGTSIDRTSPEQVLDSNDTPHIGVVQVSAGGNHTLFLKQDGSVWAMGYNGYGQLGEGTTGNHSTPVQVLDANASPHTGVVQVSAGGNHSLFLKQDSSVWAMGLNSYGQLGDGTTGNHSTPVQIFGSGISQVIAGDNHSIFVTIEGELWGVGENGSSQLGLSNSSNYNNLTRILEYGVSQSNSLEYSGSGLSLFAADHFLGRFSTQYNPLYDTVLPYTSLSHETNSTQDLNGSSGLRIQDINNSLGRTLSVWLKPENNSSIALSSMLDLELNNSGPNLYTFTLRDDSNASVVLADVDLSTPASHPGWVQISVGYRADLVSDYNQTIAGGGSHSMFIKEDGSLWSMGRNNYGQLGNGNHNDIYTPLKIQDSNISYISAGDNHSLFLKQNGSLWAMGRNDYGQLGTGNSSSSNSPQLIKDSNVSHIASGTNHSLFIKQDGSLWTMGLNDDGQLGDDRNYDSDWIHYSYHHFREVPQLISTKLPAVKIAAGDGHSLFVLADGSLWGMGRNSSGQLGTGKTSDHLCPRLIVDQNISQIAAGNNHSLFTIQDGTLWAIGENYYGQLGDGTNSDKDYPVQVLDNNGTAHDGVIQVVAGDNHSLFLKQNGSVWGMGHNSYGQLGDETKVNRSSPVQIFAGNVSRIAAGQNHSIILMNDGSMWTTGKNDHGQLGDGKATQYATKTTRTGVQKIATGTNHSLFVESGKLLAKGNNVYGQLGTGINSPDLDGDPQVIVNSGVSEVAVGEHHSLFIKDDGSLWAMGRNLEGQLGDQSFASQYSPTLIWEENVSQVASGDYHSLFILEDANKTLLGMGRNFEGQLGDGTFSNQKTPQVIDQNVTKVTAGMNHSLYLSDNGTLWGMGDSYYGQLGMGSPVTRGTPVVIDTNVSDMAAGEYHSLFILNDSNKTLMAMGRNYEGQLGDQNASTQHTPIPVDTNVSSVYAGKNHSLYIKTDGTVWTMGRNSEGQLGNLDTFSQFTPVQLETSQTISIIAAADNHTLLLDNSGNILAAGKNEYGEFGEDPYDNPTKPVQVVSSGMKLGHSLEVSRSTNHYSISINGNEEGTLHSEGNFTGASFDIHFNNYEGSLKDLKIYPFRMTELEQNESYTRENQPVPHTYTFEPRSVPTKIEATENSFILDELRLYHSSLMESELGNLWHFELPSNARAASPNLTGTSSNNLPRPSRAISIPLPVEAYSDSSFFLSRWDTDGLTDGLTNDSSGTNSSSITSLTTGNDQEIFAVGIYQNSLSWGDLSVSNNGGSNHAFFVRLENDLQPDWLSSPSDASSSSANNIIIDQEGYLHATGSFSGNFNLDGKASTSKGGEDLYLIKMDMYGQVADLRTHGGTGDENGIAIATDVADGVFVVGNFDTNGSFFDTPTMPLQSKGGSDGFYLRYDYLATIPQQNFYVIVDSNASGNNKYFIDGIESPQLDLTAGLPYFFHLDGNTTLGHPFYFGTSGVGGDGYQSEYTQGVTRSREVNGTISLSLESSLPNQLFYLCGDHAGMGNEIVIPRDPRGSNSLTYVALDQSSAPIHDGNWTVNTEGGQMVTSGQVLYEDLSVMLTYNAPNGYKLIRWEGTLPAEKEIVGESLKLPMTDEWVAHAIVSSLAPSADELSDLFTIRLDNQDANDTYKDFTFAVESSEDSPSTEGEMTLGDSLRGNFTYSLNGPSTASIIVSAFELNADQNGTWQQLSGGGFALELTVSHFNANLGNGTFTRHYNDGSVEYGTWSSSDFRKTPLFFEDN